MAASAPERRARKCSNGSAGYIWYTVEFGLIRQGGVIKVYGSGVISSHRECRNVIEGGCEVRDFSLKDVFATTVKVDELQKRLFAIESFDQLYQAMAEAEQLTNMH